MKHARSTLKPLLYTTSLTLAGALAFSASTFSLNQPSYTVAHAEEATSAAPTDIGDGTLSLDKTTAKPGDTIILKGAGFAPAKPAALLLDGGKTKFHETQKQFLFNDEYPGYGIINNKKFLPTADKKDFSVEIHLPDDLADGKHTITWSNAPGDDATVVKTITFTVGNTTPAAPESPKDTAPKAPETTTPPKQPETPNPTPEPKQPEQPATPKDTTADSIPPEKGDGQMVVTPDSFTTADFLVAKVTGLKQNGIPRTYFAFIDGRKVELTENTKMKNDQQENRDVSVEHDYATLNVKPDANGNVQFRILLAENLKPGKHTLVLSTGTNPNADLVKKADFTIIERIPVNPAPAADTATQSTLKGKGTITITPDTATAGDLVTIEGTGFDKPKDNKNPYVLWIDGGKNKFSYDQDGASKGLDVDAGMVIISGKSKPDANGHFKFQVRLPKDLPAGQHTIDLYDDLDNNGSLAVQTKFNSQAGAPETPAPSSTPPATTSSTPKAPAGDYKVTNTYNIPKPKVLAGKYIKITGDGFAQRPGGFLAFKILAPGVGQIPFLETGYDVYDNQDGGAGYISWDKNGHPDGKLCALLPIPKDLKPGKYDMHMLGGKDQKGPRGISKTGEFEVVAELPAGETPEDQGTCEPAPAATTATPNTQTPGAPATPSAPATTPAATPAAAPAPASPTAPSAPTAPAATPSATAAPAAAQTQATVAGAGKATVQTDKLEYELGDHVTVSLLGFTPGDEVSLELHSTVIPLGKVTANGAGVATFSFDLPKNLESGNHEIKATDQHGHSDSIKFQVAEQKNAGQPGQPGQPANGQQQAQTDAQITASGGGLAQTGSDISPWSLAAGISIAFAGLGAFISKRKFRK